MGRPRPRWQARPRARQRLHPGQGPRRRRATPPGALESSRSVRVRAGRDRRARSPPSQRARPRRRRLRQRRRPRHRREHHRRSASLAREHHSPRALARSRARGLPSGRHGHCGPSGRATACPRGARREQLPVFGGPARPLRPRGRNRSSPARRPLSGRRHQDAARRSRERRRARQAIAVGAAGVPLAALASAEARSFVLVLAASTAAAFLSRINARVVLPTVVVEIVLGIVIGPEVLGWATETRAVELLANFGLALLFFFAGLEVVEKHMPKRSIVRGTIGWAVSLAIGISAGYALTRLGLDAEGWLLGVALTTTALGTLVPILSDFGLLPTPLGIAVLGTGVAGEFWPIVVISVFLTGTYGAAWEVVL